MKKIRFRPTGIYENAALIMPDKMKKLIVINYCINPGLNYYISTVQLHVAAANGYIQVTEFLLDHHVAVDAVDEDLWQPVHCAACWGQVSQFKPKS